jgi:hypothetical protein
MEEPDRVAAHISFLYFPYTAPSSSSTPASTHRSSSPSPALRHMATMVRTSFPTLWMPQPSSRGGTPLFATAPPRLPLVMPAFEPG